MTIIKAAVTHEFGAPLVIEDVQLRGPLSGEVEVTLAACAICHSDIAFIDGGWGGDLPTIYGHEAAGTISAIGDNVRGYKIGDPVLVTLIRSCGCCAPCSSGAPVACDDPDLASAPITALDGEPIQQAMYCGAFAERVVVDQSQLASIPADMPMDSASLLSCGVITGVGAVVNTAQIRPGQTVVVIGAGGVGLNAIQGAQIAGASRIVAVDMVPEKLEASREFGATDTILASEPEPWRQLKNIGDGKMADAVFVTVGSIPVYEMAERYLKKSGMVYMVGLPHSGDKAELELVNMASQGQGMVGSKMGDTVLRRDIPWMIDLYSQGRLKLDELVSNRWKLEDINEAIADTKTGPSRRNVIVFR